MCAVLVFFCASARLALRFNPREGSTFFYHTVAASIPEDWLQTGEVHPRKKIGSYDTELSVVREAHEFYVLARDCLAVR